MRSAVVDKVAIARACAEQLLSVTQQGEFVPLVLRVGDRETRGIAWRNAAGLDVVKFAAYTGRQFAVFSAFVRKKEQRFQFEGEYPPCPEWEQAYSYFFGAGHDQRLKLDEYERTVRKQVCAAIERGDALSALCVGYGIEGCLADISQRPNETVIESIVREHMTKARAVIEVLGRDVTKPVDLLDVVRVEWGFIHASQLVSEEAVRAFGQRTRQFLESGRAVEVLVANHSGEDLALAAKAYRVRGLCKSHKELIAARLADSMMLIVERLESGQAFSRSPSDAVESSSTPTVGAYVPLAPVVDQQLAFSFG